MDLNYFSNHNVSVRPYGSSNYISQYNAAPIVYALNVASLKGATVDLSLSSGAITPDGLIRAMAGGVAASQGTVDDPNNGSTYVFSVVSGAATVSVETSSGTVSAFAAGIGSVISLSNIPVTIDPGSSANLRASNDQVLLKADATAINAQGFTNTLTYTAASGLQSQMAISGVGQATCDLSAPLPVLRLGAGVTGSLSSGQAYVSGSAGVLTMGNGTSAVIAPGQTSTFSCGADKQLISATSAASVGFVAGQLTTTISNGTVGVTGTTAAGVVGNSDTITLDPNATLTLGGMNSVVGGYKETLTLANGSTGDQVNGSAMTVNLGSNDSVIFGSGSGSWGQVASVHGAGDTVNLSVGTVNMDSSAAVRHALALDDQPTTGVDIVRAARSLGLKAG